MAKSELLTEMKQIAPYVRNAIIGYGNRIGKNAFFKEAVEGEAYTYILDGNKVTVTAENDQNFFKVVAFVQKMLKKEIGGGNKTDEKLDELIGEILHAVKYNDCSSERNLRNLPEIEITSDPDFEAVRAAFQQVESNLENLNESSIEGFSNVIENGKYGALKNRIADLEFKVTYQASDYSESEIDKMRDEIVSLRQQAIDMQTKIKEEASEILKQDPQKLKTVKERLKELVQIAKSSQKGSAEYESAMKEAEQLNQDNKELFAADKALKKAIEELRELKKAQQNSAERQSAAAQMGA